MIDWQLVGGVAAGVTAGACFDVAVALQALEARQVPAEHTLRASLFARLLRRPRWLAATGLAIAGWPFQVFALTLAPLTVVQPTLSVGLLILLVLGHRMLGERVGPREVLATVAIAGGVALITWAAPAHTDRHAGTAAAVIVLVVVGLAAAAPWVAYRRARRGGLVLVLGAGAAYAWTAISTKFLSDEIGRGRWAPALVWAAATGLMAGAGLLTETSALQRRAATQVAPIVSVVQTVLPVLAAPLLGGEHWRSTPLGGGVIVGALVLVSAGSAVLGRSEAVGGLLGAEGR